MGIIVIYVKGEWALQLESADGIVSYNPALDKQGASCTQDISIHRPRLILRHLLKAEPLIQLYLTSMPALEHVKCDHT